MPHHWVTECTLQARSTVLQSLQQHCMDPQLLVDLFINYDCDLESSNIFERTVNTLVKMAQRNAVGTVYEGVLTPHQELSVQLDAMQCLVCILKSLAQWTDEPTAPQVHFYSLVSARQSGVRFRP